MKLTDAGSQIEAADRALATREVDGREAKVLSLSQEFGTDVKDTWEALTDPARLARWFLPVTGELRLGGTYQLEGNAGGTVTACDPPHSFAATWEFGGGVSWIEVELTAVTADRTRFTLRHIAHPEEHWRTYGPGAVGIGWDLALFGLATHLSTGVDNDAAEFEAWSTSAEGQAFITDSGRRWRAADVAAGEDPDQAKAAAERSIAFFSATAG